MEAKNLIFCTYSEGDYDNPIVKTRKIKGRDIVFESSIHLQDNPDFKGYKKEYFTMNIIDDSGLVFEKSQSFMFDRNNYRKQMIRDKEGELYTIVIVNNDK